MVGNEHLADYDGLD